MGIWDVGAPWGTGNDGAPWGSGMLGALWDLGNVGAPWGPGMLELFGALGCWGLQDGGGSGMGGSGMGGALGWGVLRGALSRHWLAPGDTWDERSAGAGHHAASGCSFHFPAGLVLALSIPSGTGKLKEHSCMPASCPRAAPELLQSCFSAAGVEQGWVLGVPGLRRHSCAALGCFGEG